jgi:large subunit ribosomal protein L30
MERMSLLLVLNLRGKIDSTAPVRKALAELKVERRFTATVVRDDGPTRGMLRSCKDYVAWSPIDSKLLSILLKARGMVSESRRLNQDALESLGFKKYEELADKIVKDGERLSAYEGIRPFFRLSPPKGGYKLSSRRQASEKGILGSNPRLAELVGRMV